LSSRAYQKSKQQNAKCFTMGNAKVCKSTKHSCTRGSSSPNVCMYVYVYNILLQYFNDAVIDGNWHFVRKHFQRHIILITINSSSNSNTKNDKCPK